MSSESDRILAAGAPLLGVDGEEIRLRFTMLAIKRCEDTYGSIGGVVTEMRWLNEQFLTGFPEPVAARTLALVRTVADRPVEDVAAIPETCLNALNDAWLEAFPPVDAGKAVGETGTPPGRGPSSGGSPE